MYGREPVCLRYAKDGQEMVSFPGFDLRLCCSTTFGIESKVPGLLLRGQYFKELSSALRWMAYFDRMDIATGLISTI